jgi:hypothetical protein
VEDAAVVPANLQAEAKVLLKVDLKGLLNHQAAAAANLPVEAKVLQKVDLSLRVVDHRAAARKRELRAVNTKAATCLQVHRHLKVLPLQLMHRKMVLKVAVEIHSHLKAIKTKYPAKAGYFFIRVKM